MSGAMTAEKITNKSAEQKQNQRLYAFTAFASSSGATTSTFSFFFFHFASPSLNIIFPQIKPAAIQCSPQVLKDTSESFSIFSNHRVFGVPFEITSKQTA
jgi:hypothetical protein